MSCQLLVIHTLVVVTVRLALLSARLTKAVRPCPLTPYTDLDINKISGTWYAVRGIEHDSIKQTTRQRNNRACPVITFTLRDASHVDFAYDSKNGSEPRHYNMTIKDSAVPSVWTTEKGTKKHVPFSKLQVNDITDNMIALTMCSSQRLASVILSREKRFVSEVVEDITQRLVAKGLRSTRSFDRCKT